VPSYTVKSKIQGGPSQAPKKSAPKTYNPGDSIELSEHEAFEIGHALEEPPEIDHPDNKPDGPDLPPEVLLSIKGNPEHPLSGIEHYWKTRPDLSVRPDTNKSNLEIALEPERAKGEAETKAHQSNVSRPGMPPKPTHPIAEPGRPGRPTPTPPVVPPVTRPEPKR
jgi:hypothetical protein